MLHRIYAAIFSLLFVCNVHAMNEKVNEQAVSYIYYPTCKDAPLGHAELEVNGTSWDLFSRKPFSKPLDDMIYRSTHNGLPFFRFIFSTNNHKRQRLGNVIDQGLWGCSCSHMITRLLAQEGICTVPASVAISPLLTASYLAVGKYAQLNNVERIEYYGNEVLSTSIRKMMLGATVETICVTTGLSMTGFINTISLSLAYEAFLD